MHKLPPVMILAGGLGTRVSAYYPDIPKYLIPIEGEPFAIHQLRLLKKMGFTQAIICVGFKKDRIQHVLRNGESIGIEIIYSEENDGLLGTGGAIKKACTFIQSHFCMIYGDSFLDFDAQSVYQSFLKSEKNALMTVFGNDNQIEKSNIWVKDNHIIAYNKKVSTLDMRYIDYGFSLFEKKVFESIDEKKFDLSDAIQALISDNNLASHVINNRFYEVGSLQGIKSFTDYLSRKVYEKKQ